MSRPAFSVETIRHLIKRAALKLAHPYPTDLELKSNVPFGIALSLFVVFFVVQFTSAARSLEFAVALRNGVGIRSYELRLFLKHVNVFSLEGGEDPVGSLSSTYSGVCVAVNL